MHLFINKNTIPVFIKNKSISILYVKIKNLWYFNVFLCFLSIILKKCFSFVVLNKMNYN
jgi:hypothetical protein